MKTKQIGFTVPVGIAALILLLGAFSNAWAGKLDDVSIQVIGLEDIPDEALEHIPLPAPGSPSMVDIREDVLLNKPITTGGFPVSDGAELGSPSAGGDLTTVTDTPPAGTPPPQ